jgi:aspartyl-tRNA(Asn)/glutamyl-tRNA(Gln) amidotransferase subunit C
MAIPDSEIRHLEELARMTVEPSMRERIHEQLETILGYVRKLDELDTSEVEPTLHVHLSGTHVREDEVRPSLERDRLLSQAPAHEEGHFRVPRVIEEGEEGG